MSVAARASLCFALLTACGASPPPPRAPASAPSDQLGKAVDLTIPPDSGELAGLPAADARATVADFFAPSCEPCAKKVPALYRRKAELEAMGAKLV
jgi:thiol-disulfide isomerase/thioredoxin